MSKHNATKTIPLSLWQDIIKSLEYSAKNPCAHTMNKTNVAIQQLREISDWESGK